jgi:uncharacterized protein (TIGR00297 family)
MEPLQVILWIGLSLLANLGLGLAGLYAHAFDRSGLLVGLVLGTLITCVFGPGGFLIVLAFVAFGSLATRAKLEQKVARGISPPGGTARNWKNALANLSVPAFGAVVHVFKPLPLLGVFTTAAIATATFDVVATEIGKAFSSTCVTLRDLKTCEAGAPGGISVIGTASGVVAALVVSLIANGFQLVDSAMVVFIVVSALLASASESLLKSAVVVRSTHAANVTNSLLGGLIAALFAQNF